MARSDPRQTLLETVVAYASDHGVSNLTLRQLAGAVGTSHRMLLYHFGSRRGLLVAIVEENEKAQRSVATAALTADARRPLEVLRHLWAGLSDPSMGPSERLFFELYGLALQGVPGTTSLLDGIVTSWTEPASTLFRQGGATPDDAAARARLNLAVVRGLLLDLLATGDRPGTTRALEMFLRQSEAATPESATPGSG